MPGWIGHSVAFSRLISRFQLKRQPSEFWTGVLPTLAVEPHYGDDLQQLAGLTSFDPTGTAACAILLVPGVGTRLYLWYTQSIWVLAFGTVNMHLATWDRRIYDPVVTAPATAVPWFVGRDIYPSQATRAEMITGTNPAMETVIVNGVPTIKIGWADTTLSATGSDSYTSINNRPAAIIEQREEVSGIGRLAVGWQSTTAALRIGTIGARFVWSEEPL